MSEYCRPQNVLSAEPFRPSLISRLPDDSAPRANARISSIRQVAAGSWKTKLRPGIAVSDTEVRSREIATMAQHKSRRIHLFSRLHFSVCQSQAITNPWWTIANGQLDVLCSSARFDGRFDSLAPRRSRRNNDFADFSCFAVYDGNHKTFIGFQNCGRSEVTNCVRVETIRA